MIIYTHSSKILRQKLLKYNICESKIMKRFVKKRNNLILNMIISCKCARITLILNNFYNYCINCRINLRNRKINCLTIKMKIKYFRINEITRLMQLMMRDD